MDDKTIIHFGLTITTRTRGYQLNRENYAVISNRSTLGKSTLYMQALRENNEKLINSYSEIFADKEGLIYTDNWCNKHLIEVMQNYDLNTKFFESLDHETLGNMSL